MNELIQLQSSLSHIFRDALPVSSVWENPQAIKTLKKINQELSGVPSAPASASIAQIVAAYRRSQRVASFRDLKYVCYGAAMQIPDGWCVLGDDKLCNELLAEVERLDETRQRLRCFQALLSSYFAFVRYDEQTTIEAYVGWKRLRDWLERQRAQFQLDEVNKKIRLPVWFIVLTKHENLLTNKPCERYGEDMLRGDNSSIEEARLGLGIPGDSWVMQEAILSQVRAAVALVEDPFKMRLDPLLKLIQGQTEMKVSDLLKRRAIALLISRYARCTNRPEQPVLRDAAVSIIGNPWLKRTAWDASVMKPDGQIDNEAREMVNGWLKRRLITDFFDLMSADGSADPRRLKYWLRFEPVIDDLWFVLGSDAFGKSKFDPRYQEVEKRTDKKHWLRLTNESDTANNAFIMRIGNVLVVEFGLRNNACFIYSVDPVPFSLDKGAISEYQLKIHNRNGAGEKLSHSGNWEGKFDSAICPKVNYWPDRKGLPQSLYRQTIQQTSTTEPNAPLDMQLIEKFAADWKLTIKDDRDKGDALWIYAGDQISAVSHALKAWGFKYKDNRGWWKQ